VLPHSGDGHLPLLAAAALIDSDVTYDEIAAPAVPSACRD
jgi:hypothetical protein